MSNELSSDQVRRELRELDRAHRDTIPGFRAALQRLFLSGEYGESDQRNAVLAGMNRRSLLKFGGATVLGGAVLAACGSSAAKSDAGTTAAANTTAAGTTATAAGTTAAGGATTSGSAMAQDIVILRTASSLEELAVAVYATAISSGLVKTPAVGDAAKLFQSQHMEHSALFQAATKAAGGDPYAKPNPAVLKAIQPAIDALKDEAGVLALALQLEMTAAETYQASVSMFGDPKLNVAIMSVGGVEARHAAILASVLKQPAIPKAFQVTTLAVAPGTGL